MPKKQYSDKRNKFLEETKRRVRLEIEARTKERLEQLDWEACEAKGKELLKEYWDLENYLQLLAEEEWSDEEGNTPQATPQPFPLPKEENKEESSSSTPKSVVELPDQNHLQSNSKLHLRKMHPEDGETTNDKVDTPIGSDLTDYNFIDENGNPLPLDPNGNPIQHTGDNEQSTKRSPL